MIALKFSRKHLVIPYALFMGAMFSGHMTKENVKKLLPKYLRISERCGKDIELAFHPGYLQKGDELISGARADFGRFYSSPMRRAEYDALINFKD